VAIIFAIGLSVLIPAAGVAYDYSRLSTLHNDLQGSVDSISQTMSQRINACLDTIRTNNGAGGYTLDNGCLNAGKYGSDQRAFDPQVEAQKLLGSNFTQSGYDPAHPPTVLGSVEIDKYTGRYVVNAQVGYKCVFMSLLVKDCTVTASSGAVTENAFAQADRLEVTGPAAVEIWAGMPSPSLPFSLSASKGWPGYTYSIGPTLPQGLTLNSATGQVGGQAQVISCTAPCNPQALPTTQFGATDSGDPDRGGINKQTAYHNTTFTIVHRLELSYTGDNFQTVVAAGQYTYTKTPVRSGGKGPYTYSCSGLPQGHANNPFTCDASTGVIKGQPNLMALQASLSGTITVTVRDSRGITDSATIPYKFDLPPLYGRALKTVTGTAHAPIKVMNVFEGYGGWGTLQAQCSGLPKGLFCAGEGRDSKFDGHVYGLTKNSEDLVGQFSVTVIDDTGRTVTFPVKYNLKADETPEEWDCKKETWIAYVDTMYKSVHDKYGSGFTRRIYVSCGTATDLNIYAAGPYNENTGPFGKQYLRQYMTKARMEDARELARGICDALWDQHMAWDGRQGSYCTSDLVFNDITDQGVFKSATPPPAPPYCAWWKRDNGWGMTRAQGVQCYDGKGNPVS
jgi:hypothetical protein